MNNGFRSTESKKTKPQRLALCVLFLIEILLLAMPYIAMIDETGTYYSKTILDFIFSMNADDSKWIKLGIIAIVFALIPIIGFFFVAFDKTSCVKCVAACLCAFLGIFSITFVIVPQFSGVLAVGAMLAMIVYLIIFAISVSLALKTIAVRALKRKQEEEAREHNEAWLYKKISSPNALILH